MVQKSLHDPSEAEMAAAVIVGTGTSTTVGILVPFSVRLPSFQVAQLDAIAIHTGRSRNYVLNMVVRAGLSAINEYLPSEVREQLSFLAGDALSMELPDGSESGEVK